MRTEGHGLLWRGRRKLLTISVPVIVGGSTLLALPAMSAQASTAHASASARSATSAPDPGAPVLAREETSSTSATALTPDAMSACPSTDFCVWVNKNYNDGPGKFGGDNQYWSKFPHKSCPTGTWDNCASSGWNHGTSGLGVEVYQGNYGGAAACLPRGWHLANFAGYVYPGTNVKFNDTISSNYWTSNC